MPSLHTKLALETLLNHNLLFLNFCKDISYQGEVIISSSKSQQTQARYTLYVNRCITKQIKILIYHHC